MPTLRSGSFLVLCLLLPACQTTRAVTTADRTSNTELTKEWSRLALAGDHQGLAGLYTDDGVLMPPNAPAVRGRTAIREFVAAMGKITVMELELVELDGRDDLAYVAGKYRMALQLPGMASPVEDRGKYLEIRRRGSDGVWRIARDMFNSDLPPAAGK
jgi:uncharacterized protein (TIGR02246 family)